MRRGLWLAGKIVGLTLVGVLVSAVVLVGSALTVARTSWGSERMLRLALPLVNQVIAGRLDVQRFSFRGDRVILDGLSLSEPGATGGGGVVARVVRLEVRFSPLALLRRKLTLPAVIVDGPVFTIHRDQDGSTNLGRALARRPPADGARARQRPASRVAPASSSGPGVSVDLTNLIVRAAVVDVRDDGGAGRPDLRQWRVQNVELRGGGQYGEPGGEFSGHLEVTADATAPRSGPVRLVADASGTHRGDFLNGELRVDLHVMDSGARLTGRVASADALRASLNIAEARLSPSLLRLMVPASPIKAKITASGDVTWDGAASQASTHLDLAAAGGTLAVTASANIERLMLEGLAVRARKIDLGRLLTDGPPSDLSLDLDAHGEGKSLPTLRGAVTLSMPPGRLGGYAIGPVRLRADADRGRYKVLDLLAVIPGVRITGAGEATGERGAFRATIDLRDLGATVGSLTAGSPGGAPRAAGRGRIDLALSGNVLAPALHVQGSLTALTWQDVHVPELQLRADLPNLRTPLASVVTLKVPRADVGTRTFRGLSLTLRAAGPRFDAHVALAAPEAVRLDLGGAWRGRGHNQLQLEHLTLASRQVTWALWRPMRVGLTGGVLRIDGLDLRAEDGQELRIDLRKSGRSLQGVVVISRLDLARLPPSLLPPKLKLGGRLSAELAFKGKAEDARAQRPAGWNQPAIEARATWSGGRIGALREVELTTDARLALGRASGHVDLSTLGAKLNASFNLPTAWPPPTTVAPLSVDVTASNIDLRRVVAGLRTAQGQLASGGVTAVFEKPPLDVRGVASLRVRVGGTGAMPELTIESKVVHLVVSGTAVGDVAVAVEGGTHQQQALAARLELRQASMLGERASTEPDVVTVRTGLALEALLRHPPTVAQLLTSPIEIDAHVDRVSLASLAALAKVPRQVTGTASLDVKLAGTVKTVQGKLAVRVAGASMGRFPPTDAELRLELGPRDMRAEASVTRRDATLFSASAHLDAPATRLRSPESLADAPMSLHAELGPLDLQRVGLPPETDRRPARILKGRLRARVDLNGTLRAPRLNLRADAADVRLDQTELGNGVVELSYAARKISGDLTAVSANGGRLHLAASSNADLGYPQIARGLDATRLPVRARLDAKGFDVSGLSGATPGLRSVAGQLFAAVEVTGTGADPRPSGRLEWKEGGLTITGFGEYRHVHLLAHGDEDHMVLDELRADSGGGHARVTASGDHRPGHGYAVKARLDLDEFPAYVEGQALATISLQASSDAEVAVQRVRARTTISSAHLTLTDAKRKHLQKLAQPADVVLTDGDAPLNAAQARKLAAVTAILQTSPGAAPGRLGAGQGTGVSEEPAGVIVLVDAPRNLWVKGKDANIELGLQPGFRVEVTDTTRVYGSLNVKRGRVDVVGRRFDLKADSSVRLNGSTSEPELDVSATHVNDQERITVLVTVKGTPAHLQIAISAPDRPDLTETQLYTLIVTGRLDLGGGTASATTPTDRAASLLGGLMAAQLQKSLSKKLPFDVLTIEAGNGLGAAQLEAGTYVTSELYVGYVGRLGADPALLQNRNAVHLEYELGSHWSFQGEYGDANTGSADMVWTKRY